MAKRRNLRVMLHDCGSTSQPLSDDNRIWIADHVSRLLTTAKSGHSMRRVAAAAIKEAMWWWTADAFDPARDYVRRDARKYDFRSLPSSAAARESERKHRLGVKLTKGEKVQHEHVVPRKELLEYLLSLDSPRPRDVCLVLDRCCRAALITADEHRLLRKLPDDWDFQTGKVWTRYAGVSLCCFPE